MNEVDPHQIPPSEWEVETLIAECLIRRESAWEEFLRRYQDLIYSCLRRYSLPEDDTREAFQITVAAIVTSLQNLRQPDRLSSWIIGIAVRQGAKRAQAIGRERATDPEDEQLLDLPSAEELPESERLVLERTYQVRLALGTLGERCQRILSALFLEVPPKDYEALAAEEGISSGSVGPIRGRCLERMKKVFRQNGWA